MKKVLDFVAFYAEELVSILLVVAGLMALAWALNPTNIENEIKRLDAIGQEVQEVQEVNGHERGNFYSLQDEDVRFWQKCLDLNNTQKELI